MSLEKIKLEAINQFSRNGFDGTSVKDITKIVGITPPALYAHFNSKEELFICVLKECVAGLVSDITRIISVEGENVVSKLQDIYCFYINELTVLTPRITLILHNSMFPNSTLRDKIVAIILDGHKVIAMGVKNLMEEGIKKQIIKEASVEKYYRQFYKLITSHFYPRLALQVVITEEELLMEWEEFWESIKNN